MSDKGNYSLHASYTTSSQCTISNGYDNEYGNYLNLKYTGATAVDAKHVVVKYNIADLETLLAGCDKVVFYISTTGSVGTRRIIHNFGGGSVKTDYNDLRFTSGAWTRVEVSVEDFLSGQYFGAYNVGYGSANAEYRISAIVGVKAGE